MSVLVVAEQRSGELHPVSLEVVTAGRKLADDLGGEVTAVLLGPPAVRERADDLARHGADHVVLGLSEGLAEYAPEAQTAALAELIRERGPRAVLFPASARGKDLSPRVAARLGAGLASDVTRIEAADDGLQVVRPIYAGKVFARVRFTGEPALISVRPRSGPAVESPRETDVQEVTVDLDAGRSKVHFVPEEKKERPDVAEGEIVVSGGRGMQGPENWSLLEDLADALGSSAALGASRAVVDAGWRSHAEQVGQTGKVVSPKLYVAIGISGAIQHQAGMRTAGCIVAINKDPEAPIFQLADYGIVGDLFEVVPRLTEEIRKLRSEG